MVSECESLYYVCRESVLLCLQNQKPLCRRKPQVAESSNSLFYARGNDVQGNVVTGLASGGAEPVSGLEERP